MKENQVSVAIGVDQTNESVNVCLMYIGKSFFFTSDYLKRYAFTYIFTA